MPDAEIHETAPLPAAEAWAGPLHEAPPRDLAAAEITARSGEVTARSGEVAARSGEVAARSGEVAARSGEVAARSGEVTARSGEIAARSGGVAGGGAAASALDGRYLLYSPCVAGSEVGRRYRGDIGEI